MSNNLKRVGKLREGGVVELETFLTKLDAFLNKYDPKFEYNYKGKEGYTEITLQVNIT